MYASRVPEIPLHQDKFGVTHLLELWLSDD